MKEIIKLNRREEGMASILITMIMMIVISLIVLGFSQVSDREQRDALDSQLASQALYAAQSGINDAEGLIVYDINNDQTIPTASSCDPSGSPGNSYEQNLNQNLNSTVQYTCVLVNPNPSSLEYSPLDPGKSQTVPIFGQKSGANRVNSIVISWQEHDQPTNSGNFGSCPSVGKFPPAGATSWPGDTCTAGVLQVDLVPASGWTSNQSLINDERTVFLAPTNGSPSAAFSIMPPASAPDGKVIAGNCSSSPGDGQAYECYATLQGLTSVSTTGYYLHISSYYESNDINITAYDASGNALNFYDAQAVIDSTGKANDELKRIQAWVGTNPVTANNSAPDALQSTNSLCKYFTIMPGTAASGAGSPGANSC